MGKQLAIRSRAVGIAGVLLTLVIGAWFGPNSAGRIESRVEAAANGALNSLGLVEWRVTANGQSIDLRWITTGNTGGMANAHIGVDNLSVIAIPEPSAACIGGLLFSIAGSARTLGRRRRMTER
jgi:hypothetical protein